MLSNGQIKRREIFKLNQKLLKLYGDLKKAQNDMICSINQCAMDELDKANSLKVGVHKLDLKRTIKRYTDLYMNIKVLERDRADLENWHTDNENKS